MVRSLRLRLLLVFTALLVVVLAPAAFLMRRSIDIERRLDSREYHEVSTPMTAAQLAATRARLAPIAELFKRGGRNSKGLAAELDILATTTQRMVVLTDGARAPLKIAPAEFAAATIRFDSDWQVHVEFRRSLLEEIDERRIVVCDRFDLPGAGDGDVPAAILFSMPPMPGRVHFVEPNESATSSFGDPRDPHESPLHSLVSRYFWLIGALLIALLAPTLFRILRPIRELTAAVQRFGAGDRAARVVVASRDELGALGRSFNEMADQLVHAEELRRGLVADVAHELRTPLTNLRGQLEAVQDGLAAADAATVASLHDEVLLLARIVDDLQLLALADAGELPLVRAPVDVAAVVTKAAAAVRPQFDAARATLSLHVEERLPPISGDADRLGQVLRNLLANAARHAPPHSRVELAARRAGDSLELSVADRGPGIAPHLLPRLFERFVRGDPSRTRATGGAGLGLAVVRTLVEAHGGRVRAENRADGGARFVVTLPDRAANAGVVSPAA